MKRWLAAGAAMVTMLMSGAALAGSVTLYSEPNFRGDRLTINQDVDSLAKIPPWNNLTRSLVVHSGTWEICKDKRFDKCQTLVGGARVANVAEVKNLRGGVSSLREVRRRGYDDHDPWRGDRDRDRFDGWRPPPPMPPPPRYRDDDFVWSGQPQGGAGRVTSKPQNNCQVQVETAFTQRHGYRGRTEFAGDSYEGTIWWDGDPWRYRCSGGQTNIWK